MTADSEGISPDFETLLDWVEGRLPEAAAAAVADQVAAADDRTHAILAWIRGFLATARDLPLHQPPPIVRQRLRQHFAARADARQGQSGRPGPIENLVGRLVFDSRRDLAMAGSRGVADDGAVHLAFTTPAVDVLLDIERAAPGYVCIRGQALQSSDTSAAPVFEATARTPRSTVRDIDGDEQGRFVLTSVADDVTEVQVTNGVVRVTAELPLDLTDEFHDRTR